VAQHEVELILMKQVASYLAMPVFLVDPKGSLLYYNEPAEDILGQRYDETGEMPVEEWGTVFHPTDRDGMPLALEELPLVTAMQRRRPAHGDFWIRGLDGATRHIAVTAFPMIGLGRRELGSVALFWELEEDDP
jgi:PAS domain-containing protein